ncbi:MAG: SDR family oxidoreductase [Desulfobacteraceae bacterium]|nr:SDR family oxidoreductase [Desulfobacteraceae bacterium]
MKKTILITGASSGIGKKTAKYFQAKGWNVIATMRTPETQKELTTLENIHVTRLDLIDSASIRNAVNEGIEKFGRIDVLLNNAGYGAYGLLEATSMEKIRRQFDVNVFGLMETIKTVLPHFRAQKTGIIINVSSIGGKMAFPLGSLYHGSKFALEGLSEALSFEMGAIGVKVKIVEPGVIKTDFAGRSFDFNNDESLTEYQPLIQKFMSSVENMFADSSPASMVADVIYHAATDGTDQLRYTAGEDAKEYMANRKQLDDTTFMQGMKDRYGL